ncbi:MAG: carbon-nitrogen hydrolase family protein [Candidatus Limnocylindria bacterium]
MADASLTVAVVQTEPVLGDVGTNRDQLIAATKAAAAQGAELVVFPECHLSGYGFDSEEEALASAEEVPGDSTAVVAGLCRDLSVHVAFGLLERGSAGLYNTVALVGPSGLVSSYRKTHLPGIGVDRFVKAGSGPLAPVRASIGRIGLSICYDARFPEVHRSLALLGAELILLPTCWPVGSEIMPDAFVRVRAAENRVFMLVAGRIGSERGVRYIGGSRVIGPDGAVLVAATDRAGMLLCRIDPQLSHNKRVGPDASRLSDLFGDRRPALYAPIVMPGDTVAIREEGRREDALRDH